MLEILSGFNPLRLSLAVLRDVGRFGGLRCFRDLGVVGLGFRVEGLGFRGFRVEGVGFGGLGV